MTPSPINLQDIIYGPPNRKERRRRNKLQGKNTIKIIKKAENIHISENENEQNKN